MSSAESHREKCQNKTKPNNKNSSHLSSALQLDNFTSQAIGRGSLGVCLYKRSINIYTASLLLKEGGRDASGNLRLYHTIIPKSALRIYSYLHKGLKALAAQAS